MITNEDLNDRFLAEIEIEGRYLVSSGSKNVIHRPIAVAPPGRVLESKFPDPTPDILNQKLRLVPSNCALMGPPMILMQDH